MLADAPLVQEANALSMTVSIGVSAIIPEDTSADDILVRTDKALYLAKRNGRNRVEVADTIYDVGQFAA